MPADFSQYVDLIPYDLSPTDVYLGAIELGRVVLPEFEIRQGTPDDAMLQAFSYITALNVGAINRIPPRLMEGIAALMGVPRNYGQKATVSATITLNDYESFVLPIGTIFIHSTSTVVGVMTTQYETTEAVSVDQSDAEDGSGNPNPVPTVDVQLAASYVGISPHINAGDNLQVETILPQIASTIYLGDFLNGSNPEDGSYYLSRARTYLESLSSNTATARQVEAHVLTTFNYATRCKVYDLTDSDSSVLFTATDAPGNAAIFVWGVEAAVTSSRLYDILVSVTTKSTAGLYFTASNFTTVNVGVQASVAYNSSYVAADVEDAITVALLGFLSPNGFTSKAEKIKVTELQSIVSSVDGVDFVDSLTISDASNLPSGIIQLNANGDIEFLRKGLLATSNELNISISLFSQS